MSIAVAVSKHGKTVVAADTQENFGDRKVLRTNHRSAKIMKVGASYLAQTGWGIYENILTDYLSKAEAPRLRNETEVFTFFVRFWRQLHKKYSFVNDQADDDDKTPFADLDASFLVVNRSRSLQPRPRSRGDRQRSMRSSDQLRHLLRWGAGPLPRSRRSCLILVSPELHLCVNANHLGSSSGPRRHRRALRTIPHCDSNGVVCYGCSLDEPSGTVLAVFSLVIGACPRTPLIRAAFPESSRR